MATYAKGTAVGSEQSRMEIERTLSRFGATGYAYGWDGARAAVSFSAQGRQVRFILPLPDQNDKAFTTYTRGQYGSEQRRTPDAARKLYEEAIRERWRALALVIKAKLAAVDVGIVTFEQEFLGHIVLPSGVTVHEEIRGRVQMLYSGQDVPSLLPGPQS